MRIDEIANERHDTLCRVLDHPMPSVFQTLNFRRGEDLKELVETGRCKTPIAHAPNQLYRLLRQRWQLLFNRG